MGAALIRKCWDVQEERWGGEDQYDDQSVDISYQYDYNDKTDNKICDHINSTKRRSI
jgi:hypothetical protein